MINKKNETNLFFQNNCSVNCFIGLYKKKKECCRKFKKGNRFKKCPVKL